MDKAEQFIQEHHIQTLGGKDNFKEEFSGYEWSAPVFQQPSHLEEYVHLIGLIGATIQDITVIGHPGICSLLYEHRKEGFWTFELDNVLVLITDYGNFEIEYGNSSSIRISKDCIPHKFYYQKTNKDAAELKQLFSYLINDKIIGISTDRTSFDDADNDFTGSYGMELEENLSAYICGCHLLLESGRKLSFTSRFDDGIISLYNKDNQLVKLDSAL